MSEGEAQPQEERTQYYGLDEPGPDYNRKAPTDEELAVQKYREENWVEEPDKAHSMALVEDEKRTNAANARSAVNKLEDLPQKLGEIKTDIEEMGKRPAVVHSFGRKAREEREAEGRFLAKNNDIRRRREELTKEMVELFRDPLVRRAIGIEGYGYSAGMESSRLRDSILHGTERGAPEAKDKNLEVIELLADYAEKMDSEAKRRGEIAEAIYDAPPTKEYLEEHPMDIDYSHPEGLLSIEDRRLPQLEHIESIFEELNQDGKAVKDLASAVSLENNIREKFSNSYFIGAFCSKAAKDIIAEVKAVMESNNDDSMTVGQVKENAKLLTQKLKDAIAAERDYLEQIFNDVVSGRAGRPPEPGNPEQLAA